VSPQVTDEVDMNQNNNPYLTEFSQELRINMTKEEKHLWYDFLKKLPETVNRQKVVGNYILDFYCAKAKIAIELDGSQHYDKIGKEKDAVRDSFLNEQGITVLRYKNEDINRYFDNVCVDILNHLRPIDDCD
jgi:very-short-patch-repair endonuclease